MFKTQAEPRAAENVRTELTLLFFECARNTLHLTSFLLSVLLGTIATSQSARKNFDSYCKMVLWQLRYVVSQLQKKEQCLH